MEQPVVRFPVAAAPARGAHGIVTHEPRATNSPEFYAASSHRLVVQRNILHYLMRP
jgi:hypothetical protein